MGVIKHFSSGSTSSVTPQRFPNKFLFTILDITVAQDWIIVKVNYPGCDNYSGDKILIYEGVEPEMIAQATSVDPHFLESNKYLVARIAPNIQALRLLSCLVGRAVALRMLKNKII